MEKLAEGISNQEVKPGHNHRLVNHTKVDNPDSYAKQEPPMHFRFFFIFDRVRSCGVPPGIPSSSGPRVPGEQRPSGSSQRDPR